ncbi:MAG: hypothetical protein IJK26_01985 [Clostridia bacterium]|nr:hypothetical protein [Clostridia bacterium]
MFYYSVRLVLFLLCIFIYFYLYKRHHLTKIKSKIFWCVVAVVICVSFVFPIDNLLLSFSSPEKSYKYTHLGNTTVVAEGLNSSFLVEQKNEQSIYSLIPKKEDRWKTDLGHTTQLVYQKIDENIIVYFYKCKNTEDYYISVLNTNGGVSDITDNNNSYFTHIEYYDENTENSYYTYYAYIGNLEKEYSVNIDNTVISFSKK